MGTRPQHTLAYRRLCEQLRDLRAASGLTNRALAAKMKRPHSFVYKVEHGERRIDPVEFVEWVKACGGDPKAEIGRIRA